MVADRSHRARLDLQQEGRFNERVSDADTLAMANERFYGTWEPRIGRDAAEILRRRSWCALIFPLYFSALLVIVFGFSGAVSAEILLLVVTLGLWAATVPRLNRKLATAMSQHLGYQLTSKTLFRFGSSDCFDKWLEATKAGTPNRELWLHRWCTGMFVPSKSRHP